MQKINFMKKILSVLIMLGVTSSVVWAGSVEKPGATPHFAIVKEGATFKLIYKGAQPMDVKVHIRDEHNNIVFTEVLRRIDGFVRPYNFSKLPEGIYSIAISNQLGTQVESVQYDGSRQEALAHLTKVAGSEKYVLTVPRRDSNGFTVRIYDSANRVIYDKEESSAGDFAKVYNLDELSGKFLLEVTHENGATKTFHY
jgi:hypothetical protein